MKSIQILIITALMTSAAMGEKSAKVCRSDGTTPLELADPCVPWVYRDIMVGTRLTLIVHSENAGYWEYGEFSIWDEYQNYGDLDCRGGNCENSVLPDAGDLALAEGFNEARLLEDGWHDINGIIFSGDNTATIGDWFIVDYKATNVGSCQVAFMDGDFSWEEPLYIMSFNLVPSRDFNQDHIVNFEDFAVLGSYWGIINCTNPDGCGKADFDGDEIIAINDLAPFADYWLERSD